jgi:short-subunit dehydrogenase
MYMKYAVITGASQGIGKAVAERFLEERYSVAVCARQRDRLALVVNQWREQYEDADIIWLNADISTEKGIQEFSSLIKMSFPQVDILVNNAGLYKSGLIADEPEQQLERMLQTNLFGPYRLTRALLPMITDHQSGHIFNICSIASQKPIKGIASYSISKYALLGFSDNLREELREKNIKVTSVVPGATWSASWEGSGVDPERILEARDIAQMIWAATSLSHQAAAETIVMRPVKGDM